MRHVYKRSDEDIYCARGGDFRTFNATDNYGIWTDASVTEIMDHRTMLCSDYNGSYFGFVEVNDKNEWKGLDIDLYRALTTAIRGGPTRRRFYPLSQGNVFLRCSWVTLMSSSKPRVEQWAVTPNWAFSSACRISLAVHRSRRTGISEFPMLQVLRAEQYVSKQAP